MRFAVTKACGGGSSGGKARAGVLYIAGAVIETPSVLLSTRKGLPAFVSRDLLSALPSPGSHLLHVSPIHFMECPASETISNIGGLHQMLGLQQHILVAAASDSVESLPESESTNKLGASFETPCGRLLVKPAKYMEMISSMKPNMWASLADEVPAWVPEKRNATSVDRTLRWLDDCLAMGMKAGIDTLGAIVGGSSIEERKRCAKEVSRRNVSGYWIGGFGLGESSEERSDLLNAVTDCLPEEKLRFVSRLSLPEEVLQGVAAGIDLFDSTYIYHLTLGGLALVFPLDILERDSWDSHLHYDGGDCTKINLRATIYIITLGLTSITCSMSMKCWLRSYLKYTILTTIWVSSIH
ncbi:uncharacterized protein [Typha angustifolia]|uniref:uncharacterized protein isoform X3 n=1 Tax=Typha angustifolia TaxID=59011 RepID=UPI003C2FDBF5